MIIRVFHYGDFERVCEIENMCFSQPYDVNSLIRLYEAGFGFFVAEEDNEVVGYVIFGINMKCEGHIISIAVDKNYRGLKIGSNLLRHALMIYIQSGINKVVLEVRTHNIPAINLYKSFGFVIDRKEFNYYGDGSDAYIMYLDCPC